MKTVGVILAGALAAFTAKRLHANATINVFFIIFRFFIR